MNIEDINFVRQGLRFIVLIQKDLPCESLMPNSIQCWLFFFLFSFSNVCKVLFVQMDGEGREKKSLNRTHFPLVCFYHNLLFKSLKP